MSTGFDKEAEGVKLIVMVWAKAQHISEIVWAIVRSAKGLDVCSDRYCSSWSSQKNITNLAAMIVETLNLFAQFWISFHFVGGHLSAAGYGITFRQ